MKQVSVISVSLILLMTACAPDARMQLGSFVNEFGHHEIPGTSWEVEVSEIDQSATLTKHLATGHFGVRPSAWRAHTGWFVYAEDQFNIWAFDGHARLYLLASQADGPSESHWDPHFPRPVPEPVFARLPEGLQARISHEK